MQDTPLDQPGALPTTPRRGLRRPRLWGALGAIVAVGLLVALAVQLLGGRSWLLGAAAAPTVRLTPTAMPTPQPLAAVAPTTPVAGKPLIWQSHPLPANLLAAVYGPLGVPGFFVAHDMLAFAPTDSHTGYLCAHLNSSATLTIWATHDAAATWTHVSDLPFVPQPTAGAGAMPSVRPPCSITVDATDPMRLDIFSLWATTSYLSDDGGKTWRPLGPNMRLADLSTHGAVSVALQLHQGDSAPLHLIASDNDWRTWRAIDYPLITQTRGMSPTHVWERPGDGALLVEMRAPDPGGLSNTGAYDYALWESVDTGAHWTRFALPPNLLNTAPPLVAQPFGNTPWQACGVSAGSREATGQHAFLGCTRDGGKTWNPRPLPVVRARAGNGSYYHYYPTSYDLRDASLLNDGTLVSPFVVEVGVDTTNPDLFALAPGDTIWKDRRPSPGGQVVDIIRYEALLYDTRPKPIWVIPGLLTSGHIGVRGPLVLRTVTLP